MTIKQLKWTHKTINGENCEWYEADHLDYSVQPMESGWTAWRDRDMLLNFPTKEEAMDFCQNDFTKNVKKCLNYP